jgi:hypothetical protein
MASEIEVDLIRRVNALEKTVKRLESLIIRAGITLTPLAERGVDYDVDPLAEMRWELKEKRPD